MRLPNPANATIAISVFVILAAIVILILAFVHAWTPLAASDLSKQCFETFGTAQWPKWLGCAMAVHESLAAGVIGAAGALFAAWLAYSAVQQQFAHQSADRARLQAEAKFAAVMAVTQPVHAASSTLGEIRKALNDQPVRLETYFKNIEFGMNQLRVALDHFSLREVAKDLSLGDRSLFLVIVLQLGTIANIAGAKESPITDPRRRLEEQRRRLERVHHYLSLFDADLAEAFARDAGM